NPASLATRMSVARSAFIVVAPFSASFIPSPFLEDYAGLDDLRDLTCVVDVGKRITVENHNVRELARFKRARFSIDAHCARAVNRPGSQCFDRGHSKLDHQPHLFVRAQTRSLINGRCVRADDQSSARVVESLNELLHQWPCFLERRRIKRLSLKPLPIFEYRERRLTRYRRVAKRIGVARE